MKMLPHLFVIASITGAAAMAGAAAQTSEPELDLEAIRARAKVENIYIALKRVFEIAKEQGISTNEASNRLAEERLRAASAKA